MSIGLNVRQGFKISIYLKRVALVGLVQWVERRPADLKVPSSILVSSGTLVAGSSRLGFPVVGAHAGSNQSMFSLTSIFVFPFPFHSL